MKIVNHTLAGGEGFYLTKAGTELLLKSLSTGEQIENPRLLAKVKVS